MGLVQALHSAQLSRAECDYEKYLYGFLAQNLLKPSMPECADLAWARVKAARVAALALPAKIR